MTEKLYYKDPFIFTFEAKVEECAKTEKGYEIVLDKTAFFPEGGGQKSDTGKLDGAEIFDTQEDKDGKIIHYSLSPLQAGKTVMGQINKTERFRKMQNHSGEHIISGLIHSTYGYDNVGFHLSDTEVTLDINGVLNRQQLLDIEKRANEAVAEDVNIVCRFPSPEELKTIPYRSKLELEHDVRIVTIEGYDHCACCAPHVKTTGQIGMIKLLDFINYKGGVRIHMKCGFDALKDYNEKYSNVSKISVLLSSRQSEAAEAVEKLVSDMTEQKKKITALKKEIVALQVEKIEAAKEGVVLFLEDADDDIMREAVNGCVKKREGVCAALTSAGDKGYKFCIARKTGGMKAFAKAFSEKLSARGGGSEEMVRGTVKAEKSEIETFILNYNG